MIRYRADGRPRRRAGPAGGGRALTRARRAGGATAGRRRARRDRYHHGNLRAALVGAALDILAREGEAALSLREAARRAGVSPAAPYRHFRDKGALLAAAAEDGFHTLTAALGTAAAPGTGDRLTRFRNLGVAYVRFAVEHPARFRLMFGRALGDRTGYAPLEAAAQETFGVLLEGIEAGQREGVIRAGEAQPLATAAWSMVHGLSALLVDGQLTTGDQSLEDFCAGVLQYLYLGLRPETTGG